VTTETFSQIGIKRPNIPKDADAVLDYIFDWTEWLDYVTDTIASYAIEVDGVVLDSHSQNGKLITVWVSGGTAGETASVTCQITTASSRIDERTIYLLVQER